MRETVSEIPDIAADTESADICVPNGRLNAATSAASGINNKLSAPENLRLRFYNVSYNSRQNKSKITQILNDTCGEFKSGRLTAILGPSGAGKTSMLNVLSGFKAKGVRGHFEINGVERNLLAFRKMSSYIPQDFAMLDLLTVQESIQVSADFKLPAATTALDKKEIICDILQLLNMEKCSKTLMKNLSNGERKRLSIAIELVTNPPVMFFDEPTSGLDSVSSLQVVNYLRRLARDGRIIVCVVHQPSSRLMKLFDDVLVMSKGEVLFSGPQTEMIAHFEKEGYMCPNYYNPADFVLEVGSMEHCENITALIAKNKHKYCHESIDARRSSRVSESSAMLPKSVEHISLKIEQPAVQKNTTHTCHLDVIRPKEQATVYRQFSVLIRRSMLSMSRNLIAVQLRLIMHIVIAILLGIVFWQIGNDAAKVLTNSSCIFFLVMFVFFGNAMPSILLCPQDTAVFIREYLNGWYSITAYYTAKIISDLPMQFLCPTLFISIVYFMTGQPGDWGRFAMCWGISLLTAIVGHFIGLVFGSTFEMQMAIFLVPGVTIPIMIFSGFFIRIHELASFLRPLCDVSFFRYIMEGFMQAIYGYGRDDLECREDFCYYKSPQKFLKDLDMLGARYGVDVLALLLWMFALKLCFFLSLVLRIKKAQ